jgi:hypothetical protein
VRELLVPDVAVAEVEVHMVDLKELGGHEDGSDGCQLVLRFRLRLQLHPIEEVNQPNHYEEDVPILHLADLGAVQDPVNEPCTERL